MPLTLHLVNGDKVTVGSSETIDDFLEGKGIFAHTFGNERIGDWISAGSRAAVRLNAIVRVEGPSRGQ